MKRINGRNKGIGYEQKIRRELVDIGFSGCQTSRLASKISDNQKVDLVGTEPFNIQCKAVERGANYHDILKVMPKDANYNVIFHKKNRREELAILSKTDFYELVQMLKANYII